MKNRRRVDFLVLLLLLGFFGVFSSGPASAASKFEPPDGSVYTGVSPDQQPSDTADSAKVKWDEWTALMGGKPAAISHTFVGFNTWLNAQCTTAKRSDSTPLVTWQTGSTTPKTIANAGVSSSGVRTDEILLRNNWLLATHADCKDKPVFLRIDQEMNAPWYAWGPYDSAGNLKKDESGNVLFTPEDYKAMWKRMVIVVKGGSVSDINARLSAEGLPPLDPNVTMPSYMNMPSTTDPNGVVPPVNNVAFVWNPIDKPGEPDKTGNRWPDYYPGDAYVDWVGQNTYNATWNGTMEQRFQWLSAFYDEFSVKRGKPYMMGEWGLEPVANSGFGDNPAYINDVLAWAQARPKVKAMVYFSVLDSKGDYRLSTYPESAKDLAAGLKAERFLGDLTAIDQGPPRTAESRDATFAFSSPETATGHKFECSLDGVAFTACSSPASYSGLADGPHVFKVRTTDGVTPGEPAVRSWNVDATAPDTAISSGPMGTTYSTDASFGFSSEPGATFECSLDGAAYAACASPKAYSGLALGAHVFRVRAVDAAGNRDATPEERTWTTARYSASHEAETFSARTGSTANVADAGASGGYHNALLAKSSAGANPSVSRTVSVEGPVGKVVVRAKGDQCNGAPTMRVYVDGAIRWQGAVATAGYAQYAMSFSVPEGSRTIKIDYPNDYASSACNRNLRVDWMRLEQ